MSYFLPFTIFPVFHTIIVTAVLKEFSMKRLQPLLRTRLLLCQNRRCAVRRFSERQASITVDIGSSSIPRFSASYFPAPPQGLVVPKQALK
jgi:hypothetical protein